MKCAENQNGKCVIKNDIVNECIEKIMEADGVFLGSPVIVQDLADR